MGRGRGNARSRQREQAVRREALEREWAGRLLPVNDLAPLVVAQQAQGEPYHRWLRYRQGFAPELVRRFLQENSVVSGPVLDPFSGSGTVATECGRQGVSAVGLDVVGSLTFMAHARRGVDEETEARAAELLAAASGVDGEGRQKRGGHVVEKDAVLEMMRQDREAHEPPAAGRYVRGDARVLPLDTAAFRGALTSPPYLSRYDYSRVNDPAERLWSRRGGRRRQRQQLRARAGGARGAASPVHDAAEEAAARLMEDGRADEARSVRAYFADMDRVFAELARVLRPGAPLWFVVAGSDLKRTYVPGDLICAEMAESHGLRVEAVRVARRLRSTGRSLGGLKDMAPRESVIVARRVGAPIPDTP